VNARTDPLGLVYDLPIDDYHASPAISNSGLADFARSPFHFHALHLNPDRPPRVEKAGQFEGTLAHCAILEPAEFDNRYAVGPNARRGTKVWDAFEEGLPAGKVSVKRDQADVARAQALSVRSHPEIGRLLSAGKPEVSAFWIDPATGELCRCRPDWVHPVGDDAVILLDVKTYSSASPEDFALQIGRKGYHRQDAYYSAGYEAASGKTVLAFIFAAVESTWPFACSAIMLDDESIEHGRIANAALLARYAACKAADRWPSYGDSVECVTLPRWLAAAPLPTTEESNA